MKQIINLTQHQATESQIKQGLIEPDFETKVKIKELLAFDELPKAFEIKNRAKELAGIVFDIFKKTSIRTAMIGGAPFLMSTLEKKLRRFNFYIVYAFSKRVSKETLKDGKIVKTSQFEHIGFIDAM